jgi:exoribonuclease R
MNRDLQELISTDSSLDIDKVEAAVGHTDRRNRRGKKELYFSSQQKRSSTKFQKIKDQATLSDDQPVSTIDIDLANSRERKRNHALSQRGYRKSSFEDKPRSLNPAFETKVVEMDDHSHLSITQEPRLLQLPSDPKTLVHTYNKILAKHKLPPCETPEEHQFPAKAMAEIGKLKEIYGDGTKLPEQVEREIGKDGKDGKRIDLRDRFVIGIDPDDAMDMDDVWDIELLPNGKIKFLPNGNIKIGIHISDVTHFVPYHTALAREARKRGNSTYLPHGVIPMFPSYLADNLCSLREGVDRLTTTTTFEFNPETNEISNPQGPFRSVIHVSANLTYQEAEDIISGNKAKLRKRKRPYLKQIQYNLKIAAKIASVLRRKREEEGALVIKIRKPILKKNDNFEPIEFHADEAFTAHSIIEEFMLLANEHAAHQKDNLVLRIQEIPSCEGIMELHKKANDIMMGIMDEKNLELIHNFYKAVKRVKSIVHKGGKSHLEERDKIYENAARSVFLEAIQLAYNQPNNHPRKEALFRLIIEAGHEAKYDADAMKGHFSLAKVRYTNFTSPIRRCCDLKVHRALLNEDFEKSAEDHPGSIAHHITETERNSDSAEKEARQAEIQYFMVRQASLPFEKKQILSGYICFDAFSPTPLVKIPAMPFIGRLEGFIPKKSSSTKRMSLRLIAVEDHGRGTHGIVPVYTIAPRQR